jgi:hypothetical protein
VLLPPVALPRSREHDWVSAMGKVTLRIVALLAAVALAGCGSYGSSSSDQTTSATEHSGRSQARGDLATKTSLEHCLRRARVALDTSGGVPGDTSRHLHTQGLALFASYLGAVDFGNGSFADLWVFPTAAEAKDIADSAGEDPEETKDWVWQTNRNIVLAIIADARIPTNASTKAFDRCLNKA